ncbi:hypothetical protein GCM10007049_22350 [Echinicola pacifica]|uniref:Putative auto-transporter adhesin head GIN domain-containing protein n=1 Tax=Echinicola pacifica TaxID=346377 RepID=A0A918Q048_9BACT|nr:DUF2807 domain-containing protein [Echinicola pacifica]GGZ28833.1 hypothetical protein GCM10007049_22350 [Echinicola pacifica]
MKNKVKVLLALIILTSSTLVFGQTSTETRDLSVFNSISVSNAIEADLVKGETNSIEIQASGVDASNILAEIKDRQLEIKLAKGNFGTNTVKVILTYAGDIDKIEVSNSAKAFVKDVLANKTLDLRVETSSYLEAKVNVATLNLEGATNGKMFLQGTAEKLNLEAYTKSTISADKLEVKDAKVKTNTAAESVILVTGSISGSAGTAGKVWYLGDPGNVDVKSNTGGDISKKQ